MCVSAIVAIVAATAIPQVIKAIIDGPVAHRQTGQLPLFAGLVIAIALVEAAGNFIRRNLSGSVSFGMETDLRNDFYAHLQSLQVAFHDNWQSGQLLSRAIADISTIRRFVGFGLIWFGQICVTFAVVLVLMPPLDWQLAPVVAFSMLP